MPQPLPDEVMLLILEHLAQPRAEYNDSCDDRAALSALSLTSHAIRKLVREVWYRDVRLDKPAHARKLLDGLRPNGDLDLVRRTAKALHFGPSWAYQQTDEPEFTSEFAAEALAVLAVPKLELVGMYDVRLAQSALWSLQGQTTPYSKRGVFALS